MLERGEISPKVVSEWDEASKGLKLPERIRKKKLKKKMLKKKLKKLLKKRRSRMMNANNL